MMNATSTKPKKNEKKRNNKKTVNNNNFNKSTEKPRVEVFYKKFDSFEEAWKELNKIPSTPAELLPPYREEDANITIAQKILMCIFKDNIPDVSKSSNMFWSISIASNRSFIKTNKYVGFGWDIEYTVDKKQSTIKSVTLKFVSYNQFKNVNEINYVMKHDWKKKD